MRLLCRSPPLAARGLLSVRGVWRSGANSQPVLNVAYKGRVGAVHQGFLAKTNSKYVRAGSGDLAGLKQQAQERLKKKEDWKERFFVLHAGEDPWLVSRRPNPGPWPVAPGAVR